MDSKCQFYALEVMCRERAAIARKEMEYWLNEADQMDAAVDYSSITSRDPNALALEKIDASP